jgi:biotin synthase-related radical SAM superfamily protein
MLQDYDLPKEIRVSLGTAIVLSLLEGKMDAQPTTAYLMTYRNGKCTANCGFCAQARGSKSSAEMLSRVTWPTFPAPKVLTSLTKSSKNQTIKRVCIQALNYPEVFGHLTALVQQIKNDSQIPVSVSCQPLSRENIVRLAEAGVDRLGIALDAATEELFNRVKGKDAGGVYTWQNQFRQLCEALDVFGEGNVSTHVIVGLGESEKQVVEVIQRCVDMGVLPALFAFTPVKGTALEGKLPPNLVSYRRIQVARYLIVNGKSRFADMQFTLEGKIRGYGLTNEALNAEVDSGAPFQTSGCPNCNRPYYNEKPSGPIYNYPKKPNKKEMEEIKKQLS